MQATQGQRYEENAMQTRFQEMEKLNKDVQNVHAIYSELNQLVHEQGETVQNLEDLADQAEADVEVGVEQLREAADHAVSARKKKVFLIMLAIVLVIILIIVLLVTLWPYISVLF